MKTHKGTFKPKNPGKYKGDPTGIVYRSSWELKLMLYLDAHPDVIEWASEELVIPYLSPVDGKVHRYFPDFYVRKRDRNGKIETLIIEVKPLSQRRPPTLQKKATRRYVNEVRTWAINEAKWKSAILFCESKGWLFKLMSEKDLGVLNG